MNRKKFFSPAIVLAIVVSQLLLACASFKPGSIQHRPASSAPEAVSKNGISVLIKPMVLSAANTAFDYKFENSKFRPVMLSVSNNGSEALTVVPNESDGFVAIEEVYEQTRFSGGTRMLAWSTPWIIGWAATGIPIAGILWPIIGIFDVGKVGTLNTEKKEFIETNAFNPMVLHPGKEMQGIIFVEKNKIDSFSIVIKTKDEKRLVFSKSSVNPMENHKNNVEDPLFARQ